MTSPDETAGLVGRDTGWMRRLCRTQDPRSERVLSKARRLAGAARLSLPRMSVAGAGRAEVIAVGIEMANEAAAAIAVVIAVIGGDRAADDCGADNAGSDTPAQTKWSGFGLGRGGCNSACNSEGSQRESGNIRFDRHEKLLPVLRRPAIGPHARWTGRLQNRFEERRLKSCNAISRRNFAELVGSPSDFGGIRQRFRVEFVDVGEQFAKGARAGINQALAFLRGSLCRIAHGSGRVKVLRLPGERRGTIGREQMIILRRRHG